MKRFYRGLIGLGMGLILLTTSRIARAAGDIDILGGDDVMTFDEVHAGPRKWALSISPGFSDLSYRQYDGVSFTNGVAIDGSLYYRVGSWVQLGVTGGYSFNHEFNQDIFNIFGIEFFFQDRIDITYATPSIEIGPWMEGVRPWRIFGDFGAGWYEINERLDIKAASNQFLFRSQLAQRTDDYLGAQGGLGVECEVYPQGVVGVVMVYRQIFIPGHDLQLVVPTLRLSYLF